jgi:hypothetical protein
MLATLVLVAAEAGKSKTPFYILAVCLVGLALGTSFYGIANHETFPPSGRAATALVGVFILLVAGTMLTAVLTA